MSINLTFIPIKFEDQKPWADMAHVSASFDLNWEAIEALDSFLLPEGTLFRSSTDGTVAVKSDPYGKPLKFVRAWQLAKLDISEVTSWTAAAFAWIRALPPQTPIVLYWH